MVQIETVKDSNVVQGLRHEFRMFRSQLAHREYETENYTRWIGTIPFVGYSVGVLSAVRSLVQLTDAGGYLLPNILRKVRKKPFDQAALITGYGRMVEGSMNAVRAAFETGIVPIGDVFFIGIPRIMLLAYNMFGHFVDPNMKFDEGKTFIIHLKDHSILQFEKGPIFKINLLFPAYAKEIAAGKGSQVRDRIEKVLHITVAKTPSSMEEKNQEVALVNPVDAGETGDEVQGGQLSLYPVLSQTVS